MGPWARVTVAALAAIAVCASCGSGRSGTTSTGKPLQEGVFDLHYRELNVPDREYFMLMTTEEFYEYRPGDDFTRNLQLQEKLPDRPNLRRLVMYPRTPFEFAKFAAVEFNSTDSARLYVDLNGNRRLDAGETIPADRLRIVERTYIDPERPALLGRFRIPTFRYPLPDGRGTSYTAMFTAVERGSCVVWHCTCVYEGRGLLNGEPHRLVISDHLMNGRFNDFGADRYILAPESRFESPKRGDNAILLLNHRIVYGDSAYRVDFSNGDRRVQLTREANPPGRLCAEIAHHEDATSWTTLLVVGDRDKGPRHKVWSHTENSQYLPPGRYTLMSGTLYGPAPPGAMIADMSFWGNFDIDIPAGSPTVLTLGDPRVDLWMEEAVERGYGGRSNRLRRGARVYARAKISGRAGEQYYQIRIGINSQTLQMPVSIFDARGDVVTSGSMRIDGLRVLNFRWETADAPAGRYRAVVNLDTGPLAGTIRAETAFDLF